ncbi:MAG: NUDIX domain-containing protein [Blastomonas sp.]
MGLGTGPLLGNDEAMGEQQLVDARTGEPLAPATPAATLVVMRDDPQGGPAELLMVQRSREMVFAGGATVFPGGRVDPDDHAMGAQFAPHLEPDEAAARIAAIRETLEETGYCVGIDGSPDIALVKQVRQALHAGDAFSALCRDAGWRLDLDAMVAFARWRPPFNESRVFDTRFYVTRDLGESQHVEVDATENTHVFWASAQRVIDMAAEGEAKIIYPTHRNLERIALYPSYDALIGHIREFPSRMIMPRVQEREGRRYLCIPEDAGYPVTAEAIDTAMRG